jgi:sulfonate transport system substrate-binding protein
MDMNTNKKPYFRFRFTASTAIALLSLIIVSYLFVRIHKGTAPAAAPEKITIAYSATLDAVLAEVALKQGYFLKEGLDVTPHLFPYGKPAIEEVVNGNADFATVAETPVMFAVMKGNKISIVATIQTADKDNAILARRDSGILSPGDLIGRKIGVTLGTTGDYYMDVYLTLHGITRNDVKVVNLKAVDLPDAIANNAVDAISAFEPYLNYARKKLGGRGMAFYDEDIYTYMFNIVARREFIAENPGKVAKLLRALVRAEDFVNKDSIKARKIVSDFSRMDSAVVKELWPIYSFGVSLDQTLILALEDESRWAIAGGFTETKRIPNYLDFIYFKGLMTVKPDAIRILR